MAPCRPRAMPAEVAAFMQVRSSCFSARLQLYCGRLQSNGSSGWSVLYFPNMYCSSICMHLPLMSALKLTIIVSSISISSSGSTDAKGALQTHLCATRGQLVSDLELATGGGNVDRGNVRILH